MFRIHIVAAAVLSLAIGGCTSQSVSGPSTSAPESSAAASSEPAGSSPTPTVTPTATPTATPTPTPTITPITADDLVDALPTNRQMSKVQGWHWVESDQWMDGETEGPEWVRATPLTKAQAKEARWGEARKVTPTRCETVYAMELGWPSRWADPSWVKAIGYSVRGQLPSIANIRKSNMVYRWSTELSILPPGKALQWATNWRAVWGSCATYRVVGRSGDVSRPEHPKGRLAATGDASVFTTDSWSHGVHGVLIFVIEPVGDVIASNSLTILNPTPAGLKRASEVYNVMADNLAEAQGVTREPVNLATKTKAVSDKSAYVPMTPPAQV